MKNTYLIKLSLVIISFFAINTIFAQCAMNNHDSHKNHNEMNESVQNIGQNENVFKVYGKCEMCQNRIQTAALSVDGIKTANWNIDSKMLKVTFDKKVDIHKVHKAIAYVGHDTEMHKATDEIYNNLPGCCKYDRSSANSNNKEDGHNH